MIKKDYKIFSRIFYYPLALLPFLLITGPFLGDLVITLAGVTFFIISIKNKNYKFFNNFFFIYYIFFLIFISSFYFFYDVKNLYFLIKPLTMVRFLLFAVALGYIINYKKSFVNLFFKVVIFCYLILFVDSLIQYFFENNILNFKISDTGRVSSFFQDELVMGSYTVRLFPVLITIIFYKNFLKKNIFILSTLIICSVLILLSGERTSLILFLMYIFLFVIFSINFLKRKILFLLSIFLILFSIIFISPNLKTRFIDNVLFFLKGENSDNKIKIISDEHQGIYHSAYKIFLKNPFIGTGINSFKVKCKDVDYKKEKNFFDTFKCSSHPHNIYLQLLSETGIFSFFMILLIFLYFVMKFSNIFFKKISVENYNLSLYISFILTLFPLAPTANMFNNWISIFYFLPVAFYFGLNKKFYKRNLNNID